MKRIPKKAKRVLILLYVGSLVVSGLWKVWQPLPISPREGQQSIVVAVSNKGDSEAEIRYLDTEVDEDGRSVIVLLHESSHRKKMKEERMQRLTC